MAQIGVLGDIVFEVSEKRVYTISAMTWGGKSSIATTARHNTNALTEYTGMEPDTISLTISVCSWLGADPIEEMVKLWDAMREGRAMPLTIGSKPYGKYRWLISDLSDEVQQFDREGNQYSIQVTLSLIEYLRD